MQRVAYLNSEYPSLSHIRVVAFSLTGEGTTGERGSQTDAAGAIVDGHTLARARTENLNPFDYLSRNDSYHFFQPLEDLVITGPTRTNVMDVYMVLVG